MRASRSLFTIDGRQCTQIFCNQRLGCFQVNVSNEIECKVAGIFETVIIHFQNTVIVDLIYHFRFHYYHARVVVVHSLLQCVVDRRKRISLCTFQFSLCTVLIRLECFHVLAGSGECEIGQLHHGLEVLWRTSSEYIFSSGTQSGTNRNFLSGQYLCKVYLTEVTQTTYSNHIVHNGKVQCILIGEKRFATQTSSFHADLICLEIGFLDVNSYTVGQNKFCTTIDFTFFLRYDFAAFRCFFHQRFIRNLVDIRLQIETLHAFQQSNNFFFLRIF